MGMLGLTTARAINVMTDAVDGSGISYWAEVRNIEENKDGVTSFEVRDMPDGEKGTLKSWRKISGRSIEKAAIRILTGQFECRRDIAAQFIGIEWDTDCEGIDIIIQACLFDELIYG